MEPSEVDVSGYVSAGEGEILSIEAPYRSGATSMPYVLRVSGKQFFLKKLRPEYVNDVQYRNLFKKEFELGEKIRHQGVVRYEALHEDGENVYILMEYVSGRRLSRRWLQCPNILPNVSILINSLFRF